MKEVLKDSAVIEISQVAVDKIKEHILARGNPNLAVRVAIRGTLPGGGYQSEFRFEDRTTAKETDVIQQTSGFDLLFEPDVAEKMRGAKVTFDDKTNAKGFNIEYPQRSLFPPELGETKHWENPVAQKVQTILNEQINPGVAAHGGWVLLKEVKENTAHVEMGGGCQGCGLAAVTLRRGVERAILEAVPEITEIVDITSHESGEEPYYSKEVAENMGVSPFAK